MLLAIGVCDVLGKVPPPEPPTEPADQASAVPRVSIWCSSYYTDFYKRLNN